MTNQVRSQSGFTDALRDATLDADVSTRSELVRTVSTDHWVKGLKIVAIRYREEEDVEASPWWYSGRMKNRRCSTDLHINYGAGRGFVYSNLNSAWRGAENHAGDRNRCRAKPGRQSLALEARF